MHLRQNRSTCLNFLPARETISYNEPKTVTTSFYITYECVKFTSKRCQTKKPHAFTPWTVENAKGCDYLGRKRRAKAHTRNWKNRSWRQRLERTAPGRSCVCNLRTESSSNMAAADDADPNERGPYTKLQRVFIDSRMGLTTVFFLLRRFSLFKFANCEDARFST